LLPTLIRLFVLVLSLLLLTGWTSASDWSYGTGYGGDAQYSCNSKRATFTLLTQDEVAPGGFQAWPDAKTNLVCHLGTRTLRVQLATQQGHGNFECGAFGMVLVNSLAVDAVELLDAGSIHFNYPCPGTRLVISLTVRVRPPNVEFIKCEIPGENDVWAGSNAVCSAKLVDVDAVAAK
jgi:hypothetical protein